MQNPLIRFIWRVFFIATTIYGILTVWSLQSERSANTYESYSVELGTKIANIAAGSLSPWLHEQLNARDKISSSAEEQLSLILTDYMSLGDIIGIRVFNRYGETLSSVGIVHNFLDDIDLSSLSFQTHVSQIRHNQHEIGYIRFVLSNESQSAKSRRIPTPTKPSPCHSLSWSLVWRIADALVLHIRIAWCEKRC